MERGIDISVHNGIVNMTKVKNDGYSRIFIRAGYGKNNDDQRYDANAEACVRCAIPTGIYWFSYGYTEAMAAEEGRYAVAAAKRYWNRCPIAFDLEYDTVAFARKKGVEIGKDLATRMTVAFLKEVIDAGFIPVLYTNKDYKDRFFEMKTIRQAFDEKIYLWYARYTKRLTEDEKSWVDIWQKSSTGTVPGISGAVDINEIYTSFDDQPAVIEKSPATANVNIENFQRLANADGYLDNNGEKLVSDGFLGTKTADVLKKVSLKAKRFLLSYRAGSKGELVGWWQERLCELGFVTAIDGTFGAETRKKTMEFQRKFNLNVDGIVGSNSIQEMFYN